MGTSLPCFSACERGNYRCSDGPPPKHSIRISMRPGAEGVLSGSMKRRINPTILQQTATILKQMFQDLKTMESPLIRLIINIIIIFIYVLRYSATNPGTHSTLVGRVRVHLPLTVIPEILQYKNQILRNREQSARSPCTGLRFPCKILRG